MVPRSNYRQPRPAKHHRCAAAARRSRARLKDESFRSARRDPWYLLLQRRELRESREGRAPKYAARVTFVERETLSPDEFLPRKALRRYEEQPSAPVPAFLRHLFG